MKVKNIIDAAGNQFLAIEQNDSWKIIEGASNILELLDKSEHEISQLKLLAYPPEKYSTLIPFRPAAYRDFMLYEKHAIDAARGFVRKYLSHLLPLVNTYEKLLGKPFPKLKPKSRYYKYPIHYLGNHLNFISDQGRIDIPSYTAALDYELEIAAVITKPLKNASPEEVKEAIGGFVILNDFSARDVQLSEMESGFGPMKTKNFGSAISAVVVGKEEFFPRLEELNVKVIINDKTIMESTTKGKSFSFQEAIAYASWEEQLHPGELFGSGTIPGCTGIENGVMLNKGDTITLEVEGIGTLTNYIN